jgi:Zn-dependent protease
VPHIDLFGTIFLPLIFIFYLSPAISAMNVYFFLAWTKPVPMNAANFTHPRRGMFFTQFAGFGMSILLSLGAAVAGGFLYRSHPVTAEVFLGLIGLNGALMFYDLLPIPPLPGGMLLRVFGIISEEAYWSIARWGGLAVLVALNIPVTRGLMMIGMMYIQLPFAILYGAIAR